MRMIRHVAAILLTGGLAGTISSQPRPNFSGRWTIESSTPSGVVMPSSLRIVKHDASTLWEGQSERGHHSSTYALDGKDHETIVGRVKSVSRAGWVADKLVIDRKDTFPTGASRTTKQVWSLETSDKLVIVVTDQRPGQDPLTTTDVYVRK